MNDLISRRAAIDVPSEVRDCISVDGYWAIVERLKRLPSAQQWIPCNKGLPEIGKYVLCQCREGYFMVLTRTEDRYWMQDGTHIYLNGCVIAWMPLPEPYKEAKAE